MPADDGDDDAPDPQQRDEETQDRELDELTSEIRVVIPGVTVLLAFLLTLPFTTGFADLGTAQRSVYFVAFLSTTISVVFLLGESAYHRVRGKPYDKGLLIKTATRQMVTALVLLGIALASVVFLVTDLVFGRWASVLLTAFVVVLMVIIWFALPLTRRLGHGAAEESS